ncbi:hypothetical protein [Phenylobacterium sp.]|uniref:hypothetical protein n=1 Tax=Phenylobacterium sp. TaxID=1871053 RepID=UPI002FDB7610
MGALPETKLALLRSMVEMAPDRVVGDLRGALADTSGDSALVDVRLLVEAEVRDRQLRNAILAPIVPLCIGDGKTPHLTFPARALALVWRGLRDQATREVARAEALFEEFKVEESSPEPFDVLARRAAKGLRERNHPKFVAAADVADAARPDGARLLAECFAMAPVVRSAVARLPEWIQRITDEDVALARLAYRDATAIAEDAGPRFFDMLSAHLPQPWMVLRLISAVMDRPSETYLAGSELSDFGERVLAAIDAALKVLDGFDPAEDQVRRAAKAVETITAQVREMEGNVELTRQGAWGARLQRQKAALVRGVEAQLRAMDKAVRGVLISEQRRVGRLNRDVPSLAATPAPEAVQRAGRLIAFAQEIRSFAGYGGFAAAHGEAMEAVTAYLETYVDDALEIMKAGEADDLAAARATVAAAADLTAAAMGRSAAETVRRRLGAV